ncbi:MAG TPA: VTT domain-containing protein [Anseongella sp.]|nr:VTT domain-containing protein [Anseongella sp.]
MQEFWEFIQKLIHPLELLESMGSFGLTVLLLIIFAETGLFFGFFLPGDSLLFVAGMLCAEGSLAGGNVTLLIFLIAVAATLGDFVGYWFGRKTGTVIFKRKDSFFFKKKYVLQAKDFYDRYGGFAIVMGRFLPIIRTFAPIVAGVVGLDFKRFVFFNIFGAIIWSTSMTLAGYFLGKVEFVQENLEPVIIGIIVLSMIPLFHTFIKERRRRKTVDETGAATDTKEKEQSEKEFH